MQNIEKYRYIEENSERLDEIDAVLHEYRHQDTGLRFYWLERDDENKTFAIAFKTTPKDDTGVFHIIEHSVLCGSEKYPLKEPFLDLLKGSLNTFLNAMTYPDKTIYPVSSRNDKDLFNLISVYLDAVFRPLIYKRPEIFYQEGWRYEFKDEVTYNGVVYSEMKGAMAEIDDMEMSELNRLLFAGSTYAYNSGGDPLAITSLSYEDFIKTHQSYYVPSNAYVIVDGPVDILKVMALLDEYLIDTHKKADDKSAFSVKKTRTPKKVVEYETSDEDDYRIAYGKVIGDFDDLLVQYSTAVLVDVLCAHNETPLKRAILDSKLAQDINIDIIDGIARPWLKIEVKKCRENDIDKIDELIRSVLSDLAANGLDHQKLKAAITSLEFVLKEKDYGTSPSGLIYAISILESVLYGGKASAKLKIEGYFEKMREIVDDGYFEELLHRLFLDNDHEAMVVFKPSKTIAQRHKEEETRRLEKIMSAASPDEIATYKKHDEMTKRFQNIEDTKAIKDTLPHLDLSDISKEPIKIPTSVVEGDATILCHELNTSGIYYTNIYFDISDQKVDDYHYLSLLTLLMGKLKTNKHSVDELNEALSFYTGSSNIAINVYQDLDDIKRSKAKAVVSFSALKENYARTKDLMVEIINDTIIDLSTKDEIKKIIDQLKMIKRQQFTSQNWARILASDRSYARYSTLGVINDHTRGLSFYGFIKDIKDEDMPMIIRRLNEVRRFFDRHELIVSITGDKLDPSLVKDLTDRISEDTGRARHHIDLYPKQNEGIEINSDVSSLVLGYDLNNHMDYSGNLLVMSKIISFEYLWKEVRQKGGAYGTGASVLITDYMSLYSSSDPSIENTLKVCKDTDNFLANIAANCDIKTNIIGTIADEEPLMSARIKAVIADRNWIIGLSYDDQIKIREEILKTSKDDLIALSQTMAAIKDQATYCVVGNGEAIKGLDDIEVIYKL